MNAATGPLKHVPDGFEVCEDYVCAGVGEVCFGGGARGYADGDDIVGPCSRYVMYCVAYHHDRVVLAGVALGCTHGLFDQQGALFDAVAEAAVTEAGVRGLTEEAIEAVVTQLAQGAVTEV